MASITKRGNSWMAQVNKLGQRPTASFSTKAEAQAWAAKTETEIIAGKRGDVPNKTFGQLLQKYHDEVSPTKDAGDKEQVRLRMLMNDPISEVRLCDLADTHFIEWRDRMLKGTNKRKPVIGETVLRYMRIINPALNKATREWSG